MRQKSMSKNDPAERTVALEAFLHEYHVTFPVGIDQPATSGPMPMTMAAYGMRGTPTTLIFDRRGQLVRTAVTN